MSEQETIRAGIVGASGYVGGELLRLLAGHPKIEVTQATSERHEGSAVHFVHPHLRGHDLSFKRSADVEACDLLFLCLPHRKSMEQIDRFAALAPRIVDLSADFRLGDADVYERWYGSAHATPEWLEWFVYGLPELTRSELSGRTHASGVGCNATATNLSLLALAKQPDLVDWSRGVITELKVGSSEGGASSGDASHHPIRSGVVRSFAPTGHRHTAEVDQALRKLGVETTAHLSVTGVERVRGVLATTHVFLADGVTEKDLFRAYRGLAKSEPFVRFVKERRGMYRLPEPKILSGTNFADIGFDVDESTGRLVSLCAIDNLMKGAAGSAVQACNLMLGLEEETGLEFGGLHPI